jgi:hypothetical protein
MFYAKSQGVSLIELSVILVLLGLLVGTVAGTGRLIDSARAQSIVSQMTEVQSAIRTFNASFGSLPGDIASNTTILDDAGAVLSSIGTNDVGDGNGLITWGSKGNTNNEALLAWSHLDKTGIYKQGLSGGFGVATDASASNSAASDYSKAVLLSILHLGTAPSVATSYLPAGRTQLVFGGSPAATNPNTLKGTVFKDTTTGTAPNTVTTTTAGISGASATGNTATECSVPIKLAIRVDSKLDNAQSATTGLVRYSNVNNGASSAAPFGECGTTAATTVLAYELNL